uniref:CCHC-type domain-containing protein n=1 Tax=Tanacetum cinerariifolium TaxID=118510 RepID=A0A6L2KQD0_TANCI|nr:hypothetical protein [Tanacetum cinerariifolium]
MEWYRNLRIVLSTEDKLPFLEQPIPTLPVLPEEQANLPDANQELLQTVREFHTCKQEEGRSVSSYVLKIKSHIDNLERLGHAMTQNLSVSLILVSLRKEYDGFVQNFNIIAWGRQLMKEKSHKAAKGNQRNGKVKMGYAPVQAPPFAPKPKNPPKPKRDNLAKNMICHQCGEVGHWRRNCPIYLSELMKKKKLSQGASTLGFFTIELYSFPSTFRVYDTGCGTHICITTQGLRGGRKLKPKSLSLYVGDGHCECIEAIGDYHLCLPSGLVLIMYNCHYPPSITRGIISVSQLYKDGFVNHFENGLLGHAVPRSNVLYIDAEEHELGDLGEPANYNFALLDPESNKWINVMNVEMQSMKDNEVWELVDLPPNGKPLVINIRAIRILIAIVALYDYEIWQMDVKTVFLNGYLNEEVYMKQPKEPINMYCDNTGAIAIAKDHRVTKGARHFRAKVYHLRETIKMGVVRIEKVDTYDNLADPFTNALAFPKHSGLTEKIGMIPASSLITGSSLSTLGGGKAIDISTSFIHCKRSEHRATLFVYVLVNLSRTLTDGVGLGLQIVRGTSFCLIQLGPKPRGSLGEMERASSTRPPECLLEERWKKRLKMNSRVFVRAVCGESHMYGNEGVRVYKCSVRNGRPSPSLDPARTLPPWRSLDYRALKPPVVPNLLSGQVLPFVGESLGEYANMILMRYGALHLTVTAIVYSQ